MPITECNIEGSHSVCPALIKSHTVSGQMVMWLVLRVDVCKNQTRGSKQSKIDFAHTYKFEGLMYPEKRGIV